MPETKKKDKKFINLYSENTIPFKIVYIGGTRRCYFSHFIQEVQVGRSPEHVLQKLQVFLLQSHNC